MNKIVILFCLIIYFSLNSIILIDQEGNGDYIHIQQGINASISGDTILVNPGIYYENLNFLGKDITLTSQFINNPQDSLIYQTVINGQDSLSCIMLMNDESAQINGFTITNGSGYEYWETLPSAGGGIFILQADVVISNCIIKHNRSYSGGGIFLRDGNLSLSGVSINNNHSFLTGGGLAIYEDSNVYFDNENLSSIYLNYSARGSELYRSFTFNSGDPIEVLVDTFTVNNPDGYFFLSNNSVSEPQNDITIINSNPYIEPINADLYVSPDGDNNNSGLTSETPFKNINYALSVISSDSLHPNSIHISDGIYSLGANNQCFPLNMHGYVSLIGESVDNTILDAENVSGHIADFHSNLSYEISNLTLTNHVIEYFSRPGCIFISNDQENEGLVELKNLILTNNKNRFELIVLWYVDAYIENVHLINNYGGIGFHLRNYNRENQYVKFQNCSVKNLQTYEWDDNQMSYPVFITGNSTNATIYKAEINNCEFTDNVDNTTNFDITQSAITISTNVTLDIVNCTIGNNYTPGNGGAIVLRDRNTNLNIYNSILYGNTTSEIYIDNEDALYPSIVTIHNSLICGGLSNIANPYPWNSVIWSNGNIDDDPFWLGEGSEFPYALSEGSPCIDAGTLELPPGIILPEFDLAGNPRIYGDFIDMGAYEWQGVIVSNELIAAENINLTCYPNPFNPETAISFQLSAASDSALEIYNLKGQKIRTLYDGILEAGTYEYIWDGKDENHDNVPSGIYFYRLETINKNFVRKMILLK